MKLNGFVGKGSGKLGASVFAISGGEQIVRQYNPQVSNPNTDAQVAQRAKLKLMSQLAADLGEALAFKKNGLISARNQFVSRNISMASYNGEVASIGVEGLIITPGTKAAPEVTVARGTIKTNIDVETPATTSEEVKMVVAVAVEALEDNRLKVLDVKSAARQSGNSFPKITLEATSGHCFVYAYGVIPNSAGAIASYDSYVVGSSELTAELTAGLRAIIAASTLTINNCTAVAAQG